MTFVYGMVGALAVLLLFIGGAFAGWKARDYIARREFKKTAKELSADELRPMAEVQEAFRELQNYSAEKAYGMKARGEIGGER